jgi:hypothetical protein
MLNIIFLDKIKRLLGYNNIYVNGIITVNSGTTSCSIGDKYNNKNSKSINGNILCNVNYIYLTNCVPDRAPLDL